VEQVRAAFRPIQDERQQYATSAADLQGINYPPTQHTEQQRVSRTGGTWAEKYAKKIIGWDVAPTAEYFAELFRVAKNQIIWGANYFPNMPPTRCFIVWRKLTISEKFSMAMAEYAWTSFQANAKVFECAPQGKKNDVRFHPTQKPIALYKWLLANYAKEGDTILDTHLGSGSSAIACADMGFTMTGIEIDEYYYQKARERLLRHTAQLTLF
jgi:site-specific DNA-methyltransferase (adenine-specific)